jgi:hypothetical protein
LSIPGVDFQVPPFDHMINTSESCWSVTNLVSQIYPATKTFDPNIFAVWQHLGNIAKAKLQLLFSMLVDCKLALVDR